MTLNLEGSLALVRPEKSLSDFKEIWYVSLAKLELWQIVRVIYPNIRGWKNLMYYSRLPGIWVHRVKVRCNCICGDRYKGVKIDNFSTSWRSGLGFNALIHAHRPDLINYDALNPADHIGNLNNAFNVADEKLGIARLLDAEGC